MYKLVYQGKLKDDEYRNIINCYILYCNYDIRSKDKLELDELLDLVEKKYGRELCMLSNKYIIRVQEDCYE